MQMKEMGIHLLSDGAVKVDGGAIFGQVPRVAWETMVKPDRRHRVRWGDQLPADPIKQQKHPG